MAQSMKSQESAGHAKNEPDRCNMELSRNAHQPGSANTPAVSSNNMAIQVYSPQGFAPESARRPV